MGSGAKPGVGKSGGGLGGKRAFLLDDRNMGGAKEILGAWKSYHHRVQKTEEMGPIVVTRGFRKDGRMDAAAMSKYRKMRLEFMDLEAMNHKSNIYHMCRRIRDIESGDGSAAIADMKRPPLTAPPLSAPGIRRNTNSIAMSYCEWLPNNPYCKGLHLRVANGWSGQAPKVTKLSHRPRSAAAAAGGKSSSSSSQRRGRLGTENDGDDVSYQARRLGAGTLYTKLKRKMLEDVVNNLVFQEDKLRKYFATQRRETDPSFYPVLEAVISDLAAELDVRVD